eukprot:CAMPEP_0115858626 /NCGR_PEP_ID=MMETSP0287-20121206/16196_1 /TAXON_ID=412157 /ORGANISM="Chrysochromulina rotalis, Strain UIO044" /LENGTH=218 /DNA_ID=CAMNT_0003312899 /DNA_START=54 /DNA_END=710 /DNA_ORIENTATION=+
MGALEPRLGVKLLVPPMMASGIIFFSGATPPSPKGFLSGTFGCATASLAVLTLLSGRMSVAAAQGAAAGTLLVWYKATNCIFPPAAVLSVLMMQASSAGSSPMNFVVFPWLTGHVCLYSSALAVSAVRSSARVAISSQSMRKGLESLSDAALKDVFQKFDTSKDGTLDAMELRLALRTLLGTDLSVSDCKRLIASADESGDGLVDFTEFKAICRAKAD